MSADLESVKEGDRCIVRWIRRAAIGKVTRRTPRGLFTVAIGAGEYRFNAEGRQIGGSGWDTPQLHPWTEKEGQEIAEAAERDRLVSRLGHDVRWRDLSLEVLRQVDAITRPAEGSQP